MAVVAHVVEKTVTGVESNVIDGIRMCIVAIDNAVDTTDALVRARAVTVLNAHGFKLPAGYFDANALASTYDTAGDFDVWGHRGEKLAGVKA